MVKADKYLSEEEYYFEPPKYAQYVDLFLSAQRYRALEAGGVDNWDWYSESMKDAGIFSDE